MHMSMWAGDTNLFADDTDDRNLGLSKLAYHFMQDYLPTLPH